MTSLTNVQTGDLVAISQSLAAQVELIEAGVANYNSGAELDEPWATLRADIDALRQKVDAIVIRAQDAARPDTGFLGELFG